MLCSWCSWRLTYLIRVSRLSYSEYAKFLSRRKEKHLPLVTNLRLPHVAMLPQGRLHPVQWVRNVGHLQPVAKVISPVHPVVVSQTLQLYLHKHLPQKVRLKRNPALERRKEKTSKWNKKVTSELGSGDHLPESLVEAQMMSWNSMNRDYDSQVVLFNLAVKVIFSRTSFFG